MIDAAKALADDDVLPFATPTANLSSGFGVLTDDMEADGFGDAVISGCVWTDLTGSGAAAGDCVIPAATGANWWTKSGSGAKVLWLSSNGVGLILLGGAGGGGALGVITTRPSGGVGPATWKAVTLNSDGSWTVTGDDMAVIIPRY